MMDILDHVLVRLPCNQCGQTYEVPLRDVLLSHTVLQCGCPVPHETECPPVFQIRLFEHEAIAALSLAWEELAKRAKADGGELIISGAAITPARQETAMPKGDQVMDQHEHYREKGRIRQPVPTFGTILAFNLSEEVKRLESEQPWQAEHTANTIVKYPDLRIILVALKAGGRLHEHRTAGRLSIQTISGDLEVHLNDQVIRMGAGKLIAIDENVPHEVEAKTNAVFLLNIAWPK